MAQVDLRDPAAERRARRWSVVAVAVIAALALGVATLSALEQRPADHRYDFYATYGNANGVPYTLLVPLPQEGSVRATWRFLGNGSAAEEPSLYGAVLRIEAVGNITVSAVLETWRDLPASLTTEGTSAGGRPAARAFLDSTAPPANSFLAVKLTKRDPTWTLTRTVAGDLVEGWNTIEVREALERTTPAR